MKFIKNKIGYYYLNKLSERKRRIVPKNLNLIQSIGIIHSAQNRQDFLEIKKLAKHLKAEYGVRKVITLGYHTFPPKKIPNWFDETLHHRFFSKKDVNFYGKPTSGQSTDFCNEKFEVLINLDLKNTLPQKFILALSSASFKVGNTEKWNAVFCDMTIQLKENEGVDALFHHSIHYLKLINKNENINV